MGGFEVALSAWFGVSIDVFPGFSYSYSALAVLVLVLEDTASSTSTIKAKAAQLQKRWPERLGLAQELRNATRKSHTFVWVGPVRRT